MAECLHGHKNKKRRRPRLEINSSYELCKTKRGGRFTLKQLQTDSDCLLCKKERKKGVKDSDFVLGGTCPLETALKKNQSTDNINFIHVVPLHKCWDYLDGCYQLLESEWPTIGDHRKKQLKQSRNFFPTSLVLILTTVAHEDHVVGYCAIHPINKVPEACFFESVVIEKDFRKQGWGRFLMSEAEGYAVRRGVTIGYLVTTTDNELFYNKLGYIGSKPYTLTGTLSKNRNQLLLENLFPGIDVEYHMDTGMSYPICNVASSSSSTHYCNIPDPPPLPVFHPTLKKISDVGNGIRLPPPDGPQIIMKKFFYPDDSYCYGDGCCNYCRKYNASSDDSDDSSGVQHEQGDSEWETEEEYIDADVEDGERDDDWLSDKEEEEEEYWVGSNRLPLKRSSDYWDDTLLPTGKIKTNKKRTVLANSKIRKFDRSRSIIRQSRLSNNRQRRKFLYVNADKSRVREIKPPKELRGLVEKIDMNKAIREFVHKLESDEHVNFIDRTTAAATYPSSYTSIDKSRTQERSSPDSKRRHYKVHLTRINNDGKPIKLCLHYFSEDEEGADGRINDDAATSNNAAGTEMAVSVSSGSAIEVDAIDSVVADEGEVRDKTSVEGEEKIGDNVIEDSGIENIVQVNDDDYGTSDMDEDDDDGVSVEEMDVDTEDGSDSASMDNSEDEAMYWFSSENDDELNDSRRPAEAFATTSGNNDSVCNGGSKFVVPTNDNTTAGGSSGGTNATDSSICIVTAQEVVDLCTDDDEDGNDVKLITERCDNAPIDAPVIATAAVSPITVISDDLGSGITDIMGSFGTRSSSVSGSSILNNGQYSTISSNGYRRRRRRCRRQSFGKLGGRSDDTSSSVLSFSSDASGEYCDDSVDDDNDDDGTIDCRNDYDPASRTSSVTIIDDTFCNDRIHADGLDRSKVPIKVMYERKPRRSVGKIGASDDDDESVYPLCGDNYISILADEEAAVESVNEEEWEGGNGRKYKRDDDSQEYERGGNGREYERDGDGCEFGRDGDDEEYLRESGSLDLENNDDASSALTNEEQMEMMMRQLAECATHPLPDDDDDDF